MYVCMYVCMYVYTYIYSKCTKVLIVLDKVQHGFQRGKLATTNLLECNSYIANVLNSGDSCDAILFDFQRAADKIDHSILCHKLQSTGSDGCYLRWFVKFLIHR